MINSKGWARDWVRLFSLSCNVIDKRKLFLLDAFTNSNEFGIISVFWCVSTVEEKLTVEINVTTIFGILYNTTKKKKLITLALEHSSIFFSPYLFTSVCLTSGKVKRKQTSSLSAEREEAEIDAG